MSKIWVCFSPQSGMPIAVEKQMFRPTVCPSGGDWKRVYLESELRDIEAIEAQIRGYQDAMRPLLDKWHNMKKGD